MLLVVVDATKALDDIAKIDIVYRPQKWEKTRGFRLL